MPKPWLILVLSLSLPGLLPAEDFTYTTNNGTITITAYTGPGGPVTIPSTIDALPVTSIGDWAFKYRTSLTSITIPNSVNTIGDEAFAHCYSLTNANIGTNVTTIGPWAFSECTSLASVTIPDSVTNIGSRAFRLCGSLSAITVEHSNPTYTSLDGVLFDKTTNTLIQCPATKPGTYAIPTTVNGIRDYAFQQCTGLTAITIPDNLTSIRPGVFSRCSSLTTITIPDSVTTIETNAFSACWSMTIITIPNSVTNIGPWAFSGCAALANVTIPQRVESLSDHLFHDCISLATVIVGNGVTIIADYAFSGCTNLTGAHFQGNAPSAGLGVFYGSTNTTVYYLPGTTGWGPTFGGRPTASWHLPNPTILTLPPAFGLQSNSFGFRISWATNADVVVESSPTVTTPDWSPIAWVVLTDGWADFTDPDWANHPARFYRLRSP
jgi:hypothetical protein